MRHLFRFSIIYFVTLSIGNTISKEFQYEHSYPDQFSQTTCLWTALKDLRGSKSVNDPYPTLAKIPYTSFRCDQVHLPGIYADDEADCQVIRDCDRNGRLTSSLCPNKTIFNQINLACDPWFLTDCSRSRKYRDYHNPRLHYTSSRSIFDDCNQTVHEKGPSVIPEFLNYYQRNKVKTSWTTKQYFLLNQQKNISMESAKPDQLSSRSRKKTKEKVSGMKIVSNTTIPIDVTMNETIGGTPLPCDSKRCKLPRCYCDATKIPMGIDVKDTPQIVLITFDDDINSVNIGIIETVLASENLNPNGCPIIGTFFLSDTWTNYAIVESLYRKGHEFASHSINHQDMLNYNEAQWQSEIVGQAQNMHEYCKINSTDIVGMRAPFLSVGGNTMFKMLWKNGFMYDSSIPSGQTDPPLWPYTLDSPLPHKSFVERPPTGYFPALWEVPMTDYIGSNGIGCSMYDACTHPDDTEKVAELFYTNFLKHYKTNRSPYLLSAHTAWYTLRPQRELAIKAFIKRALKLGDVWFVSVKQALQWMQSPTPNSRIMEFKPWHCKKAPRTRVRKIRRHSKQRRS